MGTLRNRVAGGWSCPTQKHVLGGGWRCDMCVRIPYIRNGQQNKRSLVALADVGDSNIADIALHMDDMLPLASRILDIRPSTRVETTSLVFSIVTGKWRSRFSVAPHHESSSTDKHPVHWTRHLCTKYVTSAPTPQRHDDNPSPPYRGTYQGLRHEQHHRLVRPTAVGGM